MTLILMMMMVMKAMIFILMTAMVIIGFCKVVMNDGELALQTDGDKVRLGHITFSLFEFEEVVDITQSSSVKVVYGATSVVISTLTKSRAASPSLDHHCRHRLIVFMKILNAFITIFSIPVSLPPLFDCFHENSRCHHNNLCTWRER